jgi:hypothetical protein
LQRRQSLHNLDRLDTQSDDLADEADDLLLVAGAVRVVCDATAFVRPIHRSQIIAELADGEQTRIPTLSRAVNSPRHNAADCIVPTYLADT